MPRIKRSDLLYPDLSYKISGLCFDVQNKLGRFRSEKTYADALEIALKKSGLAFE